MKEYRTLDVAIHHDDDDDGAMWAEVIDLPGCFASGASWDELTEALQEALGMYLSSDNETVTVQVAGWTVKDENQDPDADGTRKILIDA